MHTAAWARGTAQPRTCHAASRSEPRARAVDSCKLGIHVAGEGGGLAIVAAAGHELSFFALPPTISLMVGFDALGVMSHDHTPEDLKALGILQRSPVPLKFVFDAKKSPSGGFQKYKVRIVLCGQG
eukprot:COSAG06_NODE_351_length_16930_cov_7.238904_5_plen_126_part_00